MSNFEKEKIIKTKTLLILLMVLFIASAGCSPGADSTVTTAPTNTPKSSPTSTTTPTPRPTETPTSTPTPGPFSASEIYERVSPAIAFIETGAFSGSGFLVEGNYIVTNAHVVWPYDEVRIVFPDGSEHLDTPVVGWDLLADLAVLGPINTDLPPLELVNGEDKVIGSDVFLIGYPGEVDSFPKPTITRGLISRMREWALAGISYFQTEAAIAGGQSGGVLVSDRGEVIGISGLRFTEADFGVIASANDLLPRIRQLLNGEPLEDIDMRAITLIGGKQDHQLIITPGGASAFVVDISAGEQIELEVTGDESNWFDLVDPAGTYLLSTADSARVNQLSSGQASYDGLHFLIVGQDYRVGSNSAILISSNKDLVSYYDVDDHQSLHLGQTYYGSLDYPSDYDRFMVSLAAGEEIHFKVESIMIDPFIGISYVGAGEEQEAWDDDTGKGLIGVDAELSYSAPHTGMYELYVTDVYGYQVGGYAITVDAWQQGQPTPVVPAPLPTPIVSEYGNMRRYQGDMSPFSMEIPAGMVEAPDLLPEPFREPCEQDVTCLIEPDSGLLLMTAVDDAALLGVTNVDELADSDIRLTVDQYGAELVSREKVVTGSGVEVIVLRYTFYGLVIDRLWAIFDGAAFSGSYMTTSDTAPDLSPVVEYSLSTFEVTE